MRTPTVSDARLLDAIEAGGGVLRRAAVEVGISVQAVSYRLRRYPALAYAARARGWRQRWKPPVVSYNVPNRCPHCGSMRALCGRDRTGRCDDLTRLAQRALGRAGRP